MIISIIKKINEVNNVIFHTFYFDSWSILLFQIHLLHMIYTYLFLLQIRRILLEYSGAMITNSYLFSKLFSISFIGLLPKLSQEMKHKLRTYSIPDIFRGQHLENFNPR